MPWQSRLAALSRTTESGKFDLLDTVISRSFPKLLCGSRLYGLAWPAKVISLLRGSFYTALSLLVVLGFMACLREIVSNSPGCFGSGKSTEVLSL